MPDDAQDPHAFQPFDIEVEQALLGLAMVDARYIAFMRTELNVNDFYDPLHQRIAERIFAKHEAQRPISPLTVHASMKHDAGLQEVGGHAYLAGLAQAAPACPMDTAPRIVSDLARQVADHRIRREALEAMADAQSLLDMGRPVLEALRPVTIISDQETDRVESQHGVTSATEAGYQLMREIEKPDDQGLPAARTGLRLLDNAIGGYFCANLIIAGGRPGMGKSILGELAARSAAEGGFCVDYFDLENKTNVLMSRMLCDLDYDYALSDGLRPIEFSRVHLRRLSNEEKQRLADATLRLPPNIDIHDRDELTMDQITSLCRAKAARINKPYLIIIDHMHLIEPSNRYAGRKVDEISEITRGAKRLAKRLDAAVLLLAQLNRDVEKREDKRPTMADFRESGSIEQDADIMLGLHRPRYYLERSKPRDSDPEEAKIKWQSDYERTQNLLEIGVLKNRHGGTTDIACYVDVGSSAIRDEKPTLGSMRGLDLFQGGRPGETPF